MIARVQFKLGNTQYEFELEDKDSKQTIEQAIILGNPPRFCNVCENRSFFTFTANRDKENNIYIKVKCLNKECYATADLGTYKTGGFFWHKFEKYVKEEKTDGQA